MHENWSKSFSAPWMVFWKMSWFVHNFLQNFHVVPKVYVLSRSYLDCLGYFRFFPFYAQTVLWELYGTATLVRQYTRPKKIFCLSGSGAFLFHPRFKFFIQRIVPIISSTLILFKNIWRIFFRPLAIFSDPSHSFFFPKKCQRNRR